MPPAFPNILPSIIICLKERKDFCFTLAYHVNLKSYILKLTSLLLVDIDSFILFLYVASFILSGYAELNIFSDPFEARNFGIILAYKGNKIRG
jgi:hypothetical protein